MIWLSIFFLLLPESAVRVATSFHIVMRQNVRQKMIKLGIINAMGMETKFVE